MEKTKKLFDFSKVEEGMEFSRLEPSACDENSVIEIPKSYNGFPVTAIGSHAFGSCKIKTLVIPETITRIDLLAFDGLTAEKIIFKNSLSKSVGDDRISAFGMSSIKNVIFESDEEKCHIKKSMILKCDDRGSESLIGTLDNDRNGVLCVPLDVGDIRQRAINVTTLKHLIFHGPQGRFSFGPYDVIGIENLETIYVSKKANVSNFLIIPAKYNHVINVYFEEGIPEDFIISDSKFLEFSKFSKFFLLHANCSLERYFSIIGFDPDEDIEYLETEDEVIKKIFNKKFLNKITTNLLKFDFATRNEDDECDEEDEFEEEDECFAREEYLEEHSDFYDIYDNFECYNDFAGEVFFGYDRKPILKCYEEVLSVVGRTMPELVPANETETFGDGYCVGTMNHVDPWARMHNYFALDLKEGLSLSELIYGICSYKTIEELNWNDLYIRLKYSSAVFDKGYFNEDDDRLVLLIASKKLTEEIDFTPDEDDGPFQ